MYISFFLAKNNIKKKKSDVAVVTFLIILSTMLLYISTSVLGNVNEVIDNAKNACNTADHTYFTSDEGTEFVKEIWNQLDEVRAYEISPVLYIPGVKYYSKDSSDKKDDIFIFSAIGEERDINKLNLMEEGQEKDNSIILPYYLKISEGYNIGDILHMEINREAYDFEIMGFTEDPLFATPLNITVYRCYVSSEKLKSISKTTGEKLQYNECRMLLDENKDVYEYVDTFTEMLGGRDDDSILGLVYDTMKGGLTMMPGICMGIMLAFSAILMLIAIIIMRFSIKNFIEENLKNIGILQACGYTSRQLRSSTLMEMGIIGIAGCTMGLLLSVFGEGVVGNIQAFMIGLHYSVGFAPEYGALTFAMVMAVILLITHISSRTYKRVNVLDALRGGIHTHNFKKNVIPLHKSKLPVNTAIGAKNIFGAKFKNMGILVIVAILSCASCIGFGMYENFAMDRDFMLSLVGAELGTAITSGENPEEMGAEIENWPEVEKVNYYSWADINVTNGEKSRTITCDFWENPKILDHIEPLEGSFPECDNEILISTMVRDFFGVSVGDVIYLQGDGEKKPYIVSGVMQIINNNGWKMILNYDGAGRLNGNVNTINIYIYANEGYDFEDINEAMEKNYPGITVVESAKVAESSLSVIAMSMTMICALFVIITVVVVFLVVFLLIRTKVLSDRKNNGIYKAIGYTTGNLMVQTIMSNLPVIFVGAVAGAVASIFTAGPLSCACLSFCGIEKCSVSISPIYLVGTVIGITLVAFLVAMAVSAKIRKVEPVKMLIEE